KAARGVLQAQIRLDPATRSLLHYGLGREQHMQSQFDNAVQEFMSGLTILPESNHAPQRARLLMGLGIDFQRQFNWDACPSVFEEAISLLPQDTVHPRLLAQIYTEYGGYYYRVAANSLMQSAQECYQDSLE